MPTGRSSRGEASLAACRSQAAPEKKNAGSTSRPGIECVDDLQIVFIVEFVARKDAEFFAGPEKRDRNYKCAGELEGVVLRKPKIVIPARIAHTASRLRPHVFASGRTPSSVGWSYAATWK